ncbi:hypothetical protein HPU229334_07125 [Helicobacter pullorum]|uniref:Uncharacterized protein n=1 Tax=Helicobacter pullorum TaxID=35818 RepID=A0A0N1EKK8_9HELI|nr:hypothetical protein HPU229334_07125 [Helicobacter pullorum]
MANPCGFKARVRQLFLFPKKKISYFLSKESNKQRNNCNECVEIHYGFLVGVFLPTPNLIAKKSPASKETKPNQIQEVHNGFQYIHFYPSCQMDRKLYHKF